jgi:hypothetical protein
MNCERCNSMCGEEAAFRIRSDILNLKVCGQCAKEARDLYLTVEPLVDLTEHAKFQERKSSRSACKTCLVSPPSKVGDQSFRPDISLL